MPDHRPRYHLHPQAGWINDPVGPVRWRERYHLFCQANPLEAHWARPHWAHMTSEDLVVWEHLPLALSPGDAGTPDAGGCWSGSVVDAGDVAAMHYTAIDASGTASQATCLATSDDARLRTWVKHPAPVTRPPEEAALVGFRDPFVWRRDDQWLQLVGSGFEGVGGTALLYRSRDLRTWEYRGPVLVGDVASHEPVWTGAMWECPALVEGPSADALVFSVHDGTRTCYAAATTGRFDGATFAPERTHLLDLGPDYYAPCVLRDGDRHVVWGWSWEARDETAVTADGWAGVLTLPRLLRVTASGVQVEPLPDLEALRARRLPVRPQRVGEGWRAAGAEGDAVEIAARFPRGRGVVGVRVRCSPDGAEHTDITWDRHTGSLSLDRSRSRDAGGATGGTYGGAVADAPPDAELRVFVDRSIVEVFLGGTCLTARVYPSRDDSLGVEVVGDEATPEATDVKVWEMRACVEE